MAYIECWVGSFVILRGAGPVLLRTLYFCGFLGGIRTPCPPLDPHMDSSYSSDTTAVPSKYSILRCYRSFVEALLEKITTTDNCHGSVDEVQSISPALV